MKQLLIISTFILSAVFYNSDSAKKVFVCTGKQSYAYHMSADCPGLTRCSSSIDTITISDAISMNRTPCKRCCGK